MFWVIHVDDKKKERFQTCLLLVLACWAHFQTVGLVEACLVLSDEMLFMSLSDLLSESKPKTKLQLEHVPKYLLLMSNTTALSAERILVDSLSVIGVELEDGFWEPVVKTQHPSYRLL